MLGIVETFSGIRGIYGETLTEQDAQNYAQAFLYHLIADKSVSRPKLVVGRDTRLSSPALAQTFIDVLSGLGSEIIDIGISSTPAAENAVRYFKADGGVMITGSHNPAEHNGWKLLRNDGAILSAQDAERVINYVHSGQKSEPGALKGEVLERSIESRKAYNDLLLGIVGRPWVERINEQGFKILFDAGGGAAIPHLSASAEAFGIDAVYQNVEPGVFTRPIEPTVDSLRYLIPIIQENKAEFAVGFDCDADRAEIVLENGEMVSGQYVLALIVDEMLTEIFSPQAQTVVVNDATSNLIAEIAKRHGAKVKEVEVGEINQVDAMLKLGSKVGGEGSNGGCIVSPATCRDGLLAALIILRHLVRANQSLSEALASYTKFYTLNKKLKIPGKIYNRDEVEKLFAGEAGISISKTGDSTGGIKIRYSDGAWLWFRGSKTEAGVIRVFADSKNEARSQELLERGCNLLNK